MHEHEDYLFKCKIPVSRHYSKKNGKSIFRSKSTGKLFVANSESNQALDKEMCQRIMIEKLKSRMDTITCDINLKLTFYFPKTVYFTKKGERNQKLPDLSNLYQGPEDVLQKMQVIANDNQVISHDGSRRAWINDSQYWLEIVITAKDDILIEKIA